MGTYPSVYYRTNEVKVLPAMFSNKYSEDDLCVLFEKAISFLYSEFFIFLSYPFDPERLILNLFHFISGFRWNRCSFFMSLTHPTWQISGGLGMQGKSVIIGTRHAWNDDYSEPKVNEAPGIRILISTHFIFKCSRHVSIEMRFTHGSADGGCSQCD